MTDQLAIVTGTSSGIGSALAGRLLDEGWVVFGISRREVTFPGTAYQHIQADIGRPETIIGMEPRIEAEMAFRDISKLVLVNNAATPGQLRNLGDQSSAGIYQEMAVNLSAPLALMDMVLRIRPADASLRVVNLSSGLAYRALAGAAGYCSSKAGLHMAGEVFAQEGPDRAVLNYSPGIVDTEMQQQLRGAPEADFVSVDVFKAMFEEGRLAGAGDVIAPIVDFLNLNDATGFHEARYQPPA